MLRIVLIVFLMLTVSAISFSADGSYWQNLRKKMESITPKKERIVTTAVGGIRGAKNNADENLYWQGEAQPVEVSEEEYLSFNAAVEAAMSGDMDSSREKIEKFMVDYPESELSLDARKMLTELNVASQVAEESIVEPENQAVDTGANNSADTSVDNSEDTGVDNGQDQSDGKDESPSTPSE